LEAHRYWYLFARVGWSGVEGGEGMMHSSWLSREDKATCLFRKRDIGTTRHRDKATCLLRKRDKVLIYFFEWESMNF
jgi:hypothetical protein